MRLKIAVSVVQFRPWAPTKVLKNKAFLRVPAYPDERTESGGDDGELFDHAGLPAPCSAWHASCQSNGNIRFQSFFMLITVHPFFLASSYSACVKAPTLVSGNPCGRTVGIFPRGIVVKDQHLQPCAGARTRIFQHLPVAGRVAEGRVGSPADHEVNSFGLAGVVVVEQQLWFLRQERLAVLVVAEFRARRRCRPPVGRNAVDLFANRGARSPGRRRSRCRS